jgi:hypothetical protein
VSESPAITATTPWPGRGSVPLDLLGVLADVPCMPHAACRGKAELFDGAADGDPLAQAQAVELCAQCPHIAQCREWLNSLDTSEQESLGLVAGVIPAAKRSTCYIDGCAKPVQGRGMCIAHYSEWRRAELRSKPETAVLPAQPPTRATSAGRTARLAELAQIEAQRAARRAARRRHLVGAS